MALPNVKITLANGQLGGVNPTDDSVAGLLLTGNEVEGKFSLGTHYLLNGTTDLEDLGITKENNPLIYKDVVAFYAGAGEGAELHLLAASSGTSLSDMCATRSGSPVCKLLDASSGRVRLLGVNNLPAEDYEADVAQGIDADAIEAMRALQQVAESYAGQVMPFRAMICAPNWNGDTNNLFVPNTASCNRVGMVLGSSGAIGNSHSYVSAIGELIGRASAIEVHQSIARVRDGAVVANAYFTDGKAMNEHYGKMNLLHDAGYIFFRDFPGKSGGYFNQGSMATSEGDDYSRLHNGRVIDKASVIAYVTYLEEIKDNLMVDGDGNISQSICLSLQSMIDNAILSQMGDQISLFESYINPKQNVLSTGVFDVVCRIIPQGVTDAINVQLGFSNPAV